MRGRSNPIDQDVVPLASRGLDAEQAAGRAIGDLIFAGAPSAALQTAEGRFKPHGGVPLGGNLAEPFVDNGTFLPACAGNFALLINTNLVKEPIKSWKDLQDPKWAGKILSDDPRALGAGSGWFEVTYRAFGREESPRLIGPNCNPNISETDVGMQEIGVR